MVDKKLNVNMKQINFKDLFNKHKRDEILKLHKDRIIPNFRSASLQLEAIMLKDITPCKNQLMGWRKNTMGYRGVGFSGGLPSGLRSKSSIGLTGKDCVLDHVIGATLCGEEVEVQLAKCNYNYDYLIKNWLFDNLYLWGTIKVTKEEHRKDNILRNKHLLHEKLNLDHYKILKIEDLIFAGGEKIWK